MDTEKLVKITVTNDEESFYIVEIIKELPNWIITSTVDVQGNLSGIRLFKTGQYQI